MSTEVITPSQWQGDHTPGSTMLSPKPGKTVVENITIPKVLKTEVPRQGTEISQPETTIALLGDEISTLKQLASTSFPANNSRGSSV